MSLIRCVESLPIFPKPFLIMTLWRGQNMAKELVSAALIFLGKADHELLWKRQLETFQALLSSQCRRRDQIYQVTPLQKNGGSNDLPLRMHDESVYHLGLGDMSRDLRKDFAGHSMVLLSTNFCAEPPPTSVVAKLTGRIHGRGMRVFGVPAAQTKKILRSLGLRADKLKTNTSEYLMVRFYKAPYQDKKVSPCIQNGICSLAICGTQVKKAAANGDVVCAIDNGRKVLHAFRVMSVMPAKDYMRASGHDLAEALSAKKRSWQGETPNIEQLQSLSADELRTIVSRCKSTEWLPIDVQLHAPSDGEPKRRKYLTRADLLRHARVVLNDYREREGSSSSRCAAVGDNTDSQDAEVRHSHCGIASEKPGRSWKFLTPSVDVVRERLEGHQQQLVAHVGYACAHSLLAQAHVTATTSDVKMRIARADYLFFISRADQATMLLRVCLAI